MKTISYILLLLSLNVAALAATKVERAQGSDFIVITEETGKKIRKDVIRASSIEFYSLEMIEPTGGLTFNPHIEIRTPQKSFQYNIESKEEALRFFGELKALADRK